MTHQDWRPSREAVETKLLAFAQAHEAWEADLIRNGRWEATGDGLPTLTEDIYDSMMALQALRNEAVALAALPSEGSTAPGQGEVREAVVRAGAKAAALQIDVMDPDAVDHYREMWRGKDGHDMAPVNYNSLRRLIALIDMLAFAALSAPPERSQTSGGERAALERIKELSRPYIRIERPRQTLDEVWDVADEALRAAPSPVASRGGEYGLIDDLMQMFADPYVDKLTYRAAVEIARLGDALLALQPPPPGDQPEGEGADWVTVPKKPTRAMLAAWAKWAGVRLDPERANGIWQAMLAASPAPVVTGRGEAPTLRSSLNGRHWIVESADPRVECWATFGGLNNEARSRSYYAWLFATSHPTVRAELLELSERLRSLLTPESPMHPIGCSTWEQEALYTIELAADALASLLHPAPPLAASRADPATDGEE